MNFLEELKNSLEQYHLLKHPFYIAWSEGLLSKDTLKTYSEEYYHHVAAFPRYISAIHSKCADIKARQMLLENLVEEEQGEENHPKLWQDFANSLGAGDLSNVEPVYNETKKLVDGYFDITDSSYAEGLGSLYAYERQTPEIAATKIEGLKKFYNISDEKGLKFFEVHKVADEWHTEQCEDLINALDDNGKTEVKNGAIKGAKLLWQFLDKMYEIHNKNDFANA